jgi:hypothetical protein
MSRSASRPSSANEEHSLRHQAGDKGDVAGKPVELGDHNGDFTALAGARAAAS